MRSPHAGQRAISRRENRPWVGGIFHWRSFPVRNVDKKEITVHVHEVERSVFGIEPGTAVFTAFVHFATEWAEHDSRKALLITNKLVEDAAKRAEAACKHAAREYMEIGSGLPLTYVTIIHNYSSNGVEVELRLRPYEEL